MAGIAQRYLGHNLKDPNSLPVAYLKKKKSYVKDSIEVDFIITTNSVFKIEV